MEWRAVKVINRLNGRSSWVIEKQTRFLGIKTGWTRNYQVEGLTLIGPIKAWTREGAIEKCKILSQNRPVIDVEAVAEYGIPRFKDDEFVAENA